MRNIYTILEKKRFKLVFIIPRKILYRVGKIYSYISKGAEEYKVLKQNIEDNGFTENDAKLTWEQIIYTYIDYGVLLHGRESEIKKIGSSIRIRGIENLKKAVRENKGLVLAGTHFSLFHLFFLSKEVNEYIKEVKVIRPVDSRKRRYLWEKKIPMAKGVRTKSIIFDQSNANKSSLKLYSCLRKKEVVGAVVDYLVEGTNYQEINFLGKPMACPSNIISLAVSTESTVLPLYIIRDKKGYILNIEKPIETKLNKAKNKTNISEKSEEVINVLFKKIEESLIKNISQWTHWLVIHEMRDHVKNKYVEHK